MDFQVDSHPDAGFHQKITGAAMEFYTYVNIFETKGLEYLLLISFFALFIFLLRYLSGPGKKNSGPRGKNSTTAG
jgi:hypothetical protein